MFERELANRRRALRIAAAFVVSVPAAISSQDATEAGKNDKRKRKDKNRGTSRKKDRDKGKKKKQDEGGGSSSGGGQKVVKEAQKHKGAKYRWGGESPKGFDCSGFTWYVYDMAVNMEIGRTVKDQYKKGKSVGNGSWKAGDLVFFKNTFERGLSHNGIYVSNGKFIHAENEDTGVVISTLESGYYKDHYAGARRLL